MGALVIARRSLSVLQWVLAAFAVLVILSLVVYIIGEHTGTSVPAPPLPS